MDETAPSPLLVVITRMDRFGETGVHNHIEMILEQAPKWGWETVFLSPWDRPRTMRRIFTKSADALGLLHSEMAQLWVQWGFGLIMRHRATRLLRRQANSGTVLYAQDPSTAAALIPLRERFPGTRVVLCCHFNISVAWEMVTRGSVRPGGPMTRAAMRDETKAIEGCDDVIFPSKFSRDSVVDRVDEVCGHRLHVIPHVIQNGDHAADEEAASRTDGAPPTSSWDQAEPRLITIGTLEPRKNQCFLIEMLAELKASGVPATLTIVGQGPLRGQLEELAMQRGVGDSVIFTGLLVPAAPLIEQHDLYVHASQMESFGIVLVEALARGCPVAAAPVGAVPELIRDGVEGVYLDLEDCKESAASVAELLSDPARYRDMCKTAYARYVDDLSPQQLLPFWRRAITGIH